MILSFFILTWFSALQAVAYLEHPVDFQRREVALIHRRALFEAQLDRRAFVEPQLLRRAKGRASNNPKPGNTPSSSKAASGSGLAAPLLSKDSNSPPSSPRGPQAIGKVSGTSGPGKKLTMVTHQAGYGTQHLKDLPKGKIASHPVSDPRKIKMQGYPQGGGKVEQELNAKRVKVNMNVVQGSIGTVSRQNKDGSWGKPEMHLPPEKGRHGWTEVRQNHQNNDGSPVGIKASLIGEGGVLKTTGKMYNKQPKYQPDM